MPIESIIHRERRLVHTTCTGAITAGDLMAYQEEIWVKGNVRGFHELFDASQSDFCQVRFSDLLPISQKAAQIDLHTDASKLAIVVSSANQAELAEFYRAAREVLPGESRTTKLFQTVGDALEWIQTQDS